MPSDIDRVMQEALALPPEAREILAHRLLDSLEGFANPEVERAWLEEIDRRVKEYDAGNRESIPWQEVKRRLAGP